MLKNPCLRLVTSIFEDLGHFGYTDINVPGRKNAVRNETVFVSVLLSSLVSSRRLCSVRRISCELWLSC